MHMHFVRGTAYKATSFLAEQRSFSAAFENVTVYKEYLLKEGTFLNSLICADVPLRNHSLTLSEPDTHCYCLLYNFINWTPSLLLLSADLLIHLWFHLTWSHQSAMLPCHWKTVQLSGCIEAVGNHTPAVRGNSSHTTLLHYWPTFEFR